MSYHNQPRYTQALLRRLIWETKDTEDLCDLCRLYRDLEAQGDITITQRLKMEINIQQRILIDRDLLDKQNLT